MADLDKSPEPAVSPRSLEMLRSAVDLEDSGTNPMSREEQEIIHWFKEVRFRRKLFGGVNEEDVWKKLEQLNGMFDAALRAERIRYDVLLEEARNKSAQTPQAGGSREDS